MAKKITNPDRKKVHIKKNDMVFIISGASKDLENTHRVLAVFPQEQRAIVEGANMVSRHTKPDAQNPDGGIIKKEAPIHISNLMLADPKTNKPTRIGRKEKDGKLVRYAKKSGEVID